MATETVAAPISNSRSSDVPRRNGRAESNSSARESGTDEQLDLDFGGSDSQSGSAVRGHDAPELDDLHDRRGARVRGSDVKRRTSKLAPGIRG